MATLHSALHSLAPVSFSDVPQLSEGLDEYLAELYTQVQAVVESIPIVDPNASDTRPRSKTTSSVASNASEMSSSSARSIPPAPEYQTLQKEWGKPLKLNKNENQLGISVYKLGGKDGRGAWFARRSVHEGLGFSRFKKAFQTEFPTSLAVQGAPGEGNIRGIGAETRVEDIEVPHRGKVEVYRLSAQFPGPTTPRDFVTLLVTSSRALKHETENGKVSDISPRHYMIISKPCNHPETQPRDGFIRGQYESVEFIREIPRKLKASNSSTDLSSIEHKHGHSLERDFHEKHPHPPHENNDQHHLRVNTSDPSSREPSPMGRKRSHTVNVPKDPSRSHGGPDDYDPEENPVEWIMVTRSDPGGSVPRFLVERGTPASICADAVKFLDWACGLRENESDTPETPKRHPKPFRRESFTSWQDAQSKELPAETQPQGTEKSALSPTSTKSEPAPASLQYQTPADHTGPAGIFSSVAGVISSYTPQTVLDRLPQNADTPATPPPTSTKETYDVSHVTFEPKKPDDDAASDISSTSFASADSFLGDPESNSIISHSVHDGDSTSIRKATNQHEKELAKLSQRRATMESKFAATKSKLAAQSTTATEKEHKELKRAEERHEKELKKHEERYAKELKKIEDRKQKEAKKAEERRRKAEDKDEKVRLQRERDEALSKLELLEKESEVWKKQVEELQKENTTLMQKLGKLEGGDGRVRGVTTSEEGKRSRSSSLLGKKKEKAPLERAGTGLGSEASAQSALKSETSSQGS